MIGKEIGQPERLFALTNGRVILPREIVADQAVVVEGDQILDVTEHRSLGTGIQRIDVGGRYIAPGLIDIHIHGALGHTFNEPTPEAYAAITEETATRGLTALVATVATAGVGDTVECLEFGRTWMQETQEGSQILGMHVEGPYFNLAQAGAQDPNNILTPDDGTLEFLLKHSDVIKIMTYAPELPGALELTRRLAELGIVPAAGHSMATDKEVMAAIEAGLRHAIHLWSAQSSTVREGPWRKPGLLEASLAFDELTGEIIADNRHLPPTLMKLAYKCKGPDRLCVVSDATSGAGLPEGARFRMGEMEYEVHDGVGMLFDRTVFAGSTTLLNQMIPILTEEVDIPLFDAVRMGSLTPAQVIGVDGNKGSLEVGKDADIAIFDDDFTAWRTMIGGRWAYVRSA
jgi:N-acetylglucosamine-6-phosphate deacetylase